MKGGRVVLIVLFSALTVAGWRVCADSGPGGRRAGKVVVADRIETHDSVIYTTDPGLDRAMKKEDEEEKAKEKNSWEMLHHMYLNGRAGKRPSSTQQGASPSQ